MSLISATFTEASGSVQDRGSGATTSRPPSTYSLHLLLHSVIYVWPSIVVLFTQVELNSNTTVMCPKSVQLVLPNQAVDTQVWIAVPFNTTVILILNARLGNL